MSARPYGNVLGRRCLRLAVVALAVTECAQVAKSQAFSPFSDFQNMTLAQLATLQVKATWLGAQEGPIQTVAFTSAANVVNIAKFQPFYRAGIAYFNDSLPLRTFVATAAELQAVIQQVGQISAVVAGGVNSADMNASFSMYNNVSGADKGFEAILSSVDSITLFQRLATALISNNSGTKLFNEVACNTGMIPSGVPASVTSSFSVKLGGVRLNRATGFFVGTATVMNTSTGSINGPISVVFLFPGSVTLNNFTGRTCAVSPFARPYIDLPLTGASLGAGASVTLNLEFSNPNGEAIVPTMQVLAGAGAR